MKKTRRPHTPTSANRHGSIRRLISRPIFLSFALLVGISVVAGAAFIPNPISRAFATFAQQQGGSRERRASEPVEVESVAEGTETAPLSRSREAEGPVQVIILLNDAPTTEVYAESLGKSGLPRAQAEAQANAAAQTQLQRIEREQESVSSIVRSRMDATEIYRVQRVLNGIVVSVDASELEAIRRLPGVKAVHILVPDELMNSSSVPFLRVPQLWDNSLGVSPNLTGVGIKIGIIDTGIDYIHANFSGTGAQADYEANDRTTAPDAYFPNAKVVGGRDFAGDLYNASAASSAQTNDSATPTPDDDPMDCNSHGTHVSGTAAGLGVNSDGTTYRGPYGTATPFSTLRIGPGTAPGAQLFALRVFGCIGSTNLTPQAIEYSTDPNGDGNFSDRLDVINMSLGSNFGADFDASAAASNNAALAGVVVVASAGNAGDTYFITGAPGTATRALSVAASVDDGFVGVSLTVNAPATLAGEKAASTVSYGPPPNGQTGNVVQAIDPVEGTTGSTSTDGCSPFTNAAAVSGNIAIVNRGVCTAKRKTLNAQNAGAIGVIVVNNTTDIAPPGFSDDTTITTPITIPTVVVTQNDGVAIQQELAAGNTVNVSFRQGTAGDTLANFSSRGPRRADQPLRLKPDIAAPGLSITSSLTGIQSTNSGTNAGAVTITPNSQPLTISGTSMAAPHMAGIMGLLRQLHPDWTVEELKASAMNGAINDVFVGANRAGARFGPSRIGAGRVDPVTSATNPAVAFDADEAGAVNVSAFDNEIVGTVNGRARTIRVVNKGTTDVTYTLAVDTVTDAPGVNYTLPGGNSITVPAGQTRNVTVNMNGVADQMDHTRDPTVAPTQGAAPGTPRHYLTEEGSYVTFSAGGQLRMRVPVYSTPRPASTMRATDVIVASAATASGQSAIALAGQDVCTGTRPGGAPDCTGNFPVDVVSLVTPFELQVNSPAISNTQAGSDLQYVGVSYTGTGTGASGTGLLDGTIFFGIATHGDRSSVSPFNGEFDIYIDTNSDGTDDFVLFNTTTSVGTSRTDVFTTGVIRLTGTGPAIAGSVINGVLASTRETVVYNNNVMFMGVSAAGIGLTTTSSTFRYRIETFGNDFSFVDSVGGNGAPGSTARLTFRPLAPGVNFPSSPSATAIGSGFLFPDLDGRTIPVNFNRANLTANGSLGALLLHHHNVRGTRAEVVTLQNTTTTTTDIAVGLAVDNPNPALNSNVTFTVQASNVGANDATNVRVLDQLPAGLQFVSSTPSVGTYDPATGIWTIGALAKGATATLQIVARAQTTDQVTNTARFSGADQVDSNSANNQASVTISAPRSADLALTLNSNVTTANTGDTVTYTATVTNLSAPNTGNDPAYNIVVTTAFVPPGTTIATSGVTSGVFNPATGIWNIASLGKGNSATLTFTITVGEICGNLVANASLTAETADPNTINNSASATVNVPNTAPVVTTQPVDQSVCFNTPVTFTAAASGSPAPAVQWQVSTDNGMTFTDIAGATDPNLTFTTTPEQNGNRFRARFGNFCSFVFTNSASLTVEQPQSISIGDAVAVTEGNTGTTTNAVFNVTIPAASCQAVTVNYATADGTATAGSDYTATSGSLTIPAGQTSAQINVPVIGDDVIEGNETFTVNLTNPVNVGVTRAQATGTITNDDVPGTVQFSAATYTVAESGGTATITVTRTGGTATGTSTVNYATSNGTATAGADYTATNGTIQFAAGERSKTFTIAITNDTIDEPSETVNITLSQFAGEGTPGTPATAVLTITDDDAPVTVSVNDISVAEGGSGNTVALFTVTLSAPSGQMVTVNYATGDATALAGSDYVATSGTVTFNAGETSKTVTVLVIGDTVNEPDETFNLFLLTPSNATIADNQGVGTIRNDDIGSFVQFSQATYTVAENAGSLVFTVTRSGTNTTNPATVEFQTDDSGALIRCDVFNNIAYERCDYSSQSVRINFAANETSRTVRVFINDDGFAEGNETFTVSLRDVTGGGDFGANRTATVTITDNETATTANPIDTPEFFVRQLYIDFLNREPEPTGFNAFVARLRNCPAGDTTCDRIAVAAAFSRSDEFLRNKGYFSYRFYRAALGRRQTYQEFVRDVNRLTVATGPEVEPNRAQFAVEFTQNEEFVIRYGSLNNSQYVQRLYQTANVTTTAAEQQQIAGQLDRGETTRGQVLRNLVERQDFFNREYNSGFVVAQYFGFLRRDADEQGFQNFLGLANNNSGANGVVTDAGARTVVENFVNSIEYRLRFGTP